MTAKLASVWDHHSRHAEAFAWLSGKSIVLCPLTELGFLRISSNQRAINVKMDKEALLFHAEPGGGHGVPSKGQHLVPIVVGPATALLRALAG